MINLLKADFYKLFKTKMFYILIIVCSVLTIISVGSNALLKFLAENLVDDMPIVIDGRATMFSTYNLTSNVGLIIPIFIGIFTLTDIRHGTIRNKIIIGESKTKVYLSHFIVSTTFALISIIISFILSLILSLILFGYGHEFNGTEFLNFLRCLIIGLLTFVYIASISTFFALITKSTPLTIIFTLLVAIALSIIASVSFMIPNEKYVKIFYILPTYANIMLTQTGELSLELFLFGFFSSILFIALNLFLGTLLFKKIDLK